MECPLLSIKLKNFHPCEPIEWFQLGFAKIQFYLVYFRNVIQECNTGFYWRETTTVLLILVDLLPPVTG